MSKEPVKPALKNDDLDRLTKRRRSSVLRFDEANLKKNEDELIAMGPRMKIDEPKTPFHYLDKSSVGEDAKDGTVSPRTPERGHLVSPLHPSAAEELANKALARRSEWDHDDVAMDDQPKEDFESKRKEHYKMGSLLARKPAAANVDEEEEDEGGKNKAQPIEDDDDGDDDDDDHEENK